MKKYLHLVLPAILLGYLIYQLSIDIRLGITSTQNKVLLSLVILLGFAILVYQIITVRRNPRN